MPAEKKDPRPTLPHPTLPRPALRARLWVETRGAALTDAGADLLEQIDAFGSMSEAARRLRFSYRRAWMLVDAMNKRWPAPLLTLSVGGKRGGGAKLTEYGRLVLRSYRDAQLHLEQLLDQQTEAMQKALRRR